MSRPDWDTWGLALAETVALRGDCTRRQVGAVIMDKDHRVIAVGYNGYESGGQSCLAGQCMRGRHYKYTETCPYTVAEHDAEPELLCGPFCACGLLWPCTDAVEPGSSYDTTGAGACGANHAEANALLYSDPVRRVGGTLYCNYPPCGGCEKLLRCSGLARVIAPDFEWILND